VEASSHYFEDFSNFTSIARAFANFRLKRLRGIRSGVCQALAFDADQRMAPQGLEKIESAPGNGMGSEVSNPQDVVTRMGD
jgi:hypothetical protein